MKQRHLLLMPNYAFLRWMFLLSILIVLGSPALATLGESAESVQTDSVKIHAQARIVPSRSFAVHEMLLATGTVVREFVSPEGTVFGFAWQGPFTPDLRQLLGRYFDTYVQAAQNPANRRGRGLHIDTGEMVFESGGHMRFIVGRVYLRSDLPQGVNSDAIR